MSTTTQAIDIVDQLVKAKIPKQTAKELIDFVERQQGDLATKQDIKDMATKQDIKDMATKQDTREAVRPIWAVMLAGFTIGFGLLLTVMLYLHNDTKAEMERRFTEMNRRFEKIEQLLLQRGQR